MPEVWPDKIYEEERAGYQELSTQGSDIVEFFKGKTVFITGATGFIGKLLLEKILRCCQDVETCYILCRDKKGKDLHSRVDEILNDVVYDRLSKAYPKYRHKVTPIKGDMALPGLGISAEERSLLTSKVNVIFHVAATVRFDERIDLAVKINVGGTKEMILLAKECINLESFVHVSTAFAYCTRSDLDEKFYSFPKRPDDLINNLNDKSEEELEKITPSILGDWPNSYTFTKAAAEVTIKENAKGLPICIYRPSIVVSTYQEPVRAWIDNVYGPTGVVLGAGVGILKTLHCNGDNVAEIVPGDLVVNSIIAAAYKNHAEKSDDIRIYNYVSSIENPLTWKQFMEMNQKYGQKIPTTKAFWYYSLTLNKYKILHWIYAVLLHLLPAIILDAAAFLIAKKPQLWKVYSKIHKFVTVIAYFSSRSWKFTNDNTQKLWADMSPADQKLFPFTVKGIDWDYHSQMNAMGIRTYFLKDDPSTLPAARKKWQKLWFYHNAIKAIFCFVALRIAYCVFQSIFV